MLHALRNTLRRFGSCLTVAALVAGPLLAFASEENAREFLILSAVGAAAVGGALFQARGRFALGQVAVAALLWVFSVGIAILTGSGTNGEGYPPPPPASVPYDPWAEVRSFARAISILGVLATALLVIRNRMEAGAGKRGGKFLALLRVLDGGPESQPSPWSADSVLPDLRKR